ncbi:hypothetical protein ASF88_00075 [Leifsonia sp. Leaf336]|uniref:DUF4190 domain-containing protein n=1 Tax=Leifsonia sp. Leaf336 TaxID=1736341 RepID=UPI0006F66B11|nr:DUF4190 domain-containing protein [Leifsonia sp. Leaf336]KQR53339.1 hypothetical protein ASF88_00075 [Leifsonia sp. Leaf336]
MNDTPNLATQAAANPRSRLANPALVDERRFNKHILNALVFLVICPVVSIVLGHIAYSQITRIPQRGKRLAITAVTLGYIYYAVVAVFITVMIVTAINTGSVDSVPDQNTGYRFDGYDS